MEGVEYLMSQWDKVSQACVREDVPLDLGLCDSIGKVYVSLKDKDPSQYRNEDHLRLSIINQQIGEMRRILWEKGEGHQTDLEIAPYKVQRADEPERDEAAEAVAAKDCFGARTHR